MTTSTARIATNRPEVPPTPPIVARYETLARVSRAIAAHSDPKELFGVLVDELHGAIPFDFIGVSLREKNSDTFQNYCIDMAGRSALDPEETLTLEETFTLCVYERQEALLRSTDEMEPHYGRLRAALKKQETRSICSLPLTTAHRKLGVISFGSKKLDTYLRAIQLLVERARNTSSRAMAARRANNARPMAFPRNCAAGLFDVNPRNRLPSEYASEAAWGFAIAGIP